jgi:hypothetical protein
MFKAKARPVGRAGSGALFAPAEMIIQAGAHDVVVH